MQVAITTGEGAARDAGTAPVAGPAAGGWVRKATAHREGDGMGVGRLGPAVGAGSDPADAKGAGGSAVTAAAGRPRGCSMGRRRARKSVGRTGGRGSHGGKGGRANVPEGRGGDRLEARPATATEMARVVQEEEYKTANKLSHSTGADKWSWWNKGKKGKVKG